MNKTRAVVTDHGDGIVLSLYDGEHAPLARIALDVLAALYLSADPAASGDPPSRSGGPLRPVRRARISARRLHRRIALLGF